MHRPLDPREEVAFTLAIRTSSSLRRQRWKITGSASPKWKVDHFIRALEWSRYILAGTAVSLFRSSSLSLSESIILNYVRAPAKHNGKIYFSSATNKLDLISIDRFDINNSTTTSNKKKYIKRLRAGNKSYIHSKNPRETVAEAARKWMRLRAVSEIRC